MTTTLKGYEFEQHMFKVERLQTMVARCRAQLRRVIVIYKEKKKLAGEPQDTAWLEAMEEESHRLYSLRQFVYFNPQEIDFTLTALKEYELPQPPQ